MKRMIVLALALAALSAACAPGQAKRWFNPGHNKSVSVDR